VSAKLSFKSKAGMWRAFLAYREKHSNSLKLILMPKDKYKIGSNSLKPQ
jgi:hypothetical protein